jgi:hypothetical protein
MRIRHSFFGTGLVMLVTSGCTNALYVYQTEKFALSLEGRPDSTQPVQGSVGGKERVAIVAPAKATTGGAQAGEAVSLLSYFEFKTTEPKAKEFFGGVRVRTALITGEAASTLNEDAAGKAAAAFTREVTFADNVALVCTSPAADLLERVG